MGQSAMDDSEAPEPSAHGTFTKTPLSHLLVYALERKLTGTFELTAPASASPPRPAQSMTMRVTEGRPSKIRTAEPTLHLGRVLLELGMFNETQYEASLKKLTDKKLHGQILLDSGLITKDQLEIGLRAQLERKLRFLISFPPTTEFTYYDGFDALRAYGGESSASLDPLPIVWEAVRDEPPWEHVRTALSRVGAAGLKLAGDADVARFRFDAAELALLELFRARPRRVQQIVEAGLLNPKMTQQLIYCLLITKHVELVHEHDVPPSSAVPQAASTFELDEPDSQTVGRLQLHGRPAPRVIEERAANLAPDDRRTPPAPPPTPRVEAADLAPSSLEGPTPQRDKQTAPAFPAPKPRPRQGRVAPEVHTRPTVRSMQAIRMDVPGDATTRPPPDISSRPTPVAVPIPPEAKRDAKARSAKASEAKVTEPADPPRKPAPEPSPSPPAASPMAPSVAPSPMLSPRNVYEASPENKPVDAINEAAQSFHKAQLALESGDPKKAEVLAKRAADLAPENGDYLALHAWAVAQRPEKQGLVGTELAIEKLDRAVRLSSKCERAYFYRGTLHKRLDRHDEALKDFRTALELSPGNLDTQREIRLIELRKSGKGEDKPGLFGKLFKK
jgi:hypothetical protein